MTAEDNVATIERIYQAFGEGDVVGFTAKASGESARLNLHQHFRFDHEGKIEFVRRSEDTELVAATLAGQPARATSAATS